MITCDRPVAHAPGRIVNCPISQSGRKSVQIVLLRGIDCPFRLRKRLLGVHAERRDWANTFGFRAGRAPVRSGRIWSNGHGNTFLSTLNLPTLQKKKTKKNFTTSYKPP